jgi:hypothetical protein
VRIKAGIWNFRDQRFVNVRQTVLNDRGQVTSGWQWMAVVAAWYVVELCQQLGHMRESQRKRRLHGSLLEVAVGLLHARCIRVGMRVKTDLGRVMPVKQGVLRSK